MINRKTIYKAFLILSIAISIHFLFPILLHSATFTVDSTADTVDASLEDGVCADESGYCTLRAAIQQANSLMGADTINIPAGTFSLSITNTGEDNAATGDLDIIDDLTIVGAGAFDTIIDGGEIDRIFDILGSVIVNITKVKAQNGNLAFGQSGGGIRNAGSLMLNEFILTENNTGWFGTGGGIANWGTLYLTDTTISGNTAHIDNGTGGGIVNWGTLHLTNTTISGNTAYAVGGIGNIGDLILTNVNIAGNMDKVRGAGIYNEGTATLRNVTISGNKSGLCTTCAGGIGNIGTLNLTNVTISGNTGGGGGGIWIPFAGPSPYLTQLKNTIVANNLNKNCSFTLHPVVSLGYNTDNDGSCNLTQPNDLPNTDPLLDEFTDDGAPGRGYFPLLETSPAIDKGDDAACLLTDQLGNTRVDGDGDGVIVCDIGAVEFLPPYIEVEIDIKPGSYPNSINLKSKGKIPVAILTTNDFDAYDVDPVACIFAGAYPVRWNMEDVDRDGDNDMIVHFETQELDLEQNSTEASLKCETYDRLPITGTDSVNIVPKGKSNKKKIN